MGLSDLFKPRWRHSDYRVRVKQAEALKDPAILAQIALRDESGDVRLTALSRLSDQMVIAQIASSDPKPSNRMYALERLHDRGGLTQVMNNQRGSLNVRLAAAIKLGDAASAQTLCTQLALSSGAPTGTSDLVRDIIADEASLIQVATGAKESHVRAAAALKVCDQNALRAIALSDPDDGVRRCAVANITDQNILYDVVLSANDWKVREAAAEKLTNQALIAKLVIEKCGAVRPGIVKDGYVVHSGLSGDLDILIKKCTDKDVLERSARSISPGVRAAAVAQVNDQVLLAEVAIADESFDVRNVAINNLTDQAALAAVAGSDAHFTLRWDVVSRLTDQGILAELAKNSPERSLRVHAVEWMTDKFLLADLAHSGPEGREEEVVKEVHLGGDEFRDRTTLEFVPDARETARGRLAELKRRRHNKS